MSRSRIKNLPQILNTEKYRKFRSNDGTIVVSSNNYLGVSKMQSSTTRIGDIAKQANIVV